METDLTIQKMADQNARIVKFKRDADIILKEMQSVAILVKSPKDLRKMENLKKLQKMIKDFESAKNSFGNESTVCWLQSYIDFLTFYQENDEEFDNDDVITENSAKKSNFSEEKPAKSRFQFTYSDLPAFLNSEPQYKPMIRYSESECVKNSEKCIESFIFTTGFTDVVKYNEMYPVVSEWRWVLGLE